MHLDQRIFMEPGSPKKGDTVRLEYRGLLKESGADSVWLRCGFDGWSNTQDIYMNRTPYGDFACNLQVQGTREMNFCFKDSAEHFDNNNGQNWNIPIK